MPIQSRFQPEHLTYLLDRCRHIPDRYVVFRDRLTSALHAEDVQEYLRIFTTTNKTQYLPCALCIAPTTNEASSTCISCQESSDILKRLLSSSSLIWATTIEGGKLLDSLSHLASLHDRRNIYCPDCRGLIWSPAPFKPCHFEDCPHATRQGSETIPG